MTSMTFVLSKLVWTLLSPASVLLFAVVGAAVLQRFAPRLSRWLLAGSALFLLALSFTPVGRWSLSVLEDRFPHREPAAPVDGIIVLGGALSLDASAELGRPVLGPSGERLTALIELARAWPRARLVFSGGSGSVLHPDSREADYVRAFAASMGLDPSRVALDRDSRNTWENALYSKRMIQPRETERWVLITSAWHMPRAVGCFRAAGWNVIPYPVDYHSVPRGDWPVFELLEQLNLFSIAAREWVGLVAYRVLHRSDAWLPAPAGQ